MDSVPQSLLRLAGLSGVDSFPDFNVDRVAWNASWEALAPALFRMNDIFEVLGGAPDEAFLATYGSCFEELCLLQYFLTLSTRTYYAMGFEERWQSLTPEVRQQHMLEGHVRTCIFNHGDSERSQCSDITLKSMETCNGKGYLDLLRFYFLDDTTSPPKSPIRYPHPGSTQCSTFTEVYLVGRDLYICGFLYFTLASFYNQPRIERNGPVRKGSMKPKITPRLKKMSKLTNGLVDLKEMKQQVQALEAGGLRYCESCGMQESSPPFMHCKACKEALGRRTFYCSRKCQKVDWPRHKQICGKELTPEIARSMAISSKRVSGAVGSTCRPNAIIQIGLTEGNYKRSPALATQVHLLNNMDPEIIYFLVNLRTNKFFPITIDRAAERAAFRAVRDKAAKTGDRSAVAALGQALLRVTAAENVKVFGRSDVISQLIREYEGPVEKDIAVLEMIAERDGSPMQISKLAQGLSLEVYNVTSV